MKKIFLEFAGYRICLILHPCKQTFLREKFESEVFDIYKKNLIKLNSEKADIVLHVIDHTQKIITHPKNNEFHTFVWFLRSAKNRIYTFYYISIYQLSYVLTMLIDKQLSKGTGFLLHASACLKKSTAELFVGISGAGKSTAVSLLSTNYKSLADEIVILKKEGNRFYVHQPPLIDLVNHSARLLYGFPLGNIYFLRKAKFFRVSYIKDKNWLFSNFSRQLWIDQRNIKSESKILFELIKKKGEFYFLYFAKNRQKMVDIITKKVL